MHLSDRRMLPRFQALWMIGLFGLSLFAMAIDEVLADSHTPVFDVYALQATAGADVPNDLMTATLVAQAEDADAAKVAEEVNVIMEWAVETLADFPDIDVETLGYQTRPRYEGNTTRRIIGWHGSQSLQLETGDFDKAAAAIQALQARLQVVGMRMSTRPETRDAAEDALIADALAAFRRRATLIQESMGATGYRIVDVGIGSDGYHAPAYQARGMSLEADAARVATGPSIEAGSSRVSVRVDGRIQLESPSSQGGQ